MTQKARIKLLESRVERLELEMSLVWEQIELLKLKENYTIPYPVPYLIPHSKPYSPYYPYIPYTIDPYWTTSCNVCRIN